MAEENDVYLMLGDDLGELDDGGDAKAPVAQRLDDLGEPPQQLGRGLPVERGGDRLLALRLAARLRSPGSVPAIRRGVRS